MHPRISTSGHEARSVAHLKSERGLSVSVCLPALNEERTIGPICDTIASLMPDIVDELVVIDSGSTDDTLAIARAAGATGYPVREILDHIPIEAGGKGEALWKSLAVVNGDIVLWLDSDTRNFVPAFVLDLLAPLLEDESVQLSKAFYERPLEDPTGALTTGGARVTELLLRPLAHALFPELTGFIQPLSGEYASHRSLLRSIPMFTGYGVEVGLLIDFADRVGLEHAVQVDLGSRVHRNQEILPLGRMAFQVAQVMMLRAEQLGRVKLATEWPEVMTQFRPGPAGPALEEHRLQVSELPPMETVAGTG